MTLNEVFTMLNSITGFSGKVAYRAFPKGKAPKLPYICYLATQTNNFAADDEVYKVIQGIDIELYTSKKEPATEELVETALNNNHIVWEKYEDYIEDENCYMITYEVEV